MDKIKIAVSGRVATVVDMPEVVADNAEYAVSFAVNPQDGWDMANPITALFVRRDGKYSAVVMAAGETECVMPPARGTTMVFAGLTQDETRTTTPAQIPVRRSVRNLTDFPPLPDKDVYAQILTAFAGIKTISGEGAPTTETKGAVNQIYRDEDTQRLYICTDARDGVYTWAAVSGSGGGGSVDVDATLTKAGYAADAKAVGDALAEKADAKAVAAALAGKANTSDIPSVPSWAMADTKPTYTAAEVGALPNTTAIPDVSGKVDKQQGAANAGKILGIGDDGVVVPTAKPVQALAGSTAPTETTVGVVGQEYYVIVNNAVTGMYVCTSALIGSYTWDKVEFGSTYTLPEATATALGGIKADDVEETDTQAVRKGADGKLYTAPGNGGTYTLPTASPTTLGGVKPIAKTDAMTQGVGVDDAGALFTLPGGGSGEKPWRILRDIMITETVSGQTQNVTYYTNDNGKVKAIEFSVDEDGAAFSVNEIVVIGFIENLETTGTGCGIGIFKGTYAQNKDITYIREGLLTGKKQTIYIHCYNLFDQYTMTDFYSFQQYQKSGFQGSLKSISGSPAFGDTSKLLDGWNPQAAPPWTQFAVGTSGQGINGRIVFFAR